MRKAAIFASLMALIFCLVTSSALCADRHLDQIVEKADAIAAVKILSTDYTATATDGPMYAEAKVLKVLKGSIHKGSKLGFGESGWWGPTYTKGESRIVFLSRVDSKNEYFEEKWHTVYAGGVDFFFVEDSLENISQASLLRFLSDIQDVDSTPPGIEFNMTQKNDTTRILSVEVINQAGQAFWIKPSRVTASLEAGRIRYSREVNWVGYQSDTWIKIDSGSSIRGLVEIKTEEIEGEDKVKVTVSHLSACFPYRCWIGVRSADVRLGN